MKRKQTQTDSNLVELLLYSDRPVIVNTKKIVYAMTQLNPETDEEFTRVTLEGGIEVDIQEKMHELSSKLIN